MKPILNLLFAIWVLSGCSNKITSSNNSNSALEKKCIPVIEAFFSDISNGTPEVAVDNLLLSNSFINKSDSTILELKNKFILINKLSGKFVGYTLLKKREISNDLAIFSYLSKYETKFYRFVFLFYNNGSDVRIYKFMFDSVLDIEIEESLKLYTY